MMHDGYHYLAAPYTSPHAATRRLRLELINAHAAHLMAEGLVIYSPLTHGAVLVAHGLPDTDWRFWARPSRVMLLRADVLRVLALPGHRESRGVQEEIGWALQIGIPIIWDEYLEPGSTPAWRA